MKKKKSVAIAVLALFHGHFQNFRFLGAKHETLSVSKFKHQTLVAAYIVRFAFATIPDTPTAIVPQWTVAYNLSRDYVVERIMFE
jgi:hypothetical protein